MAGKLIDVQIYRYDGWWIIMTKCLRSFPGEHGQSLKQQLGNMKNYVEQQKYGHGNSFLFFMFFLLHYTEQIGAISVVFTMFVSGCSIVMVDYQRVSAINWRISWIYTYFFSHISHSYIQLVVFFSPPIWKSLGVIIPNKFSDTNEYSVSHTGWLIVNFNQCL